MNRATIARVGSLAPVGVCLYAVTHFGTVTTIVAAVTVGAAVWTGAKLRGNRGGQAPAPAVEPQQSAEEYVQAWEPPALSPAAPHITAAGAARLNDLRKPV